MTSSISWTDGAGAATLTNGKAEPATRFADWVVNRKPIGPAFQSLGTGITSRVRFRTDQTVSFSLNAIPESDMGKMIRLEYHLLRGGTVVLVGDRAMVDQFATCTLAPGTEPTISQSDSTTREYTFSCVLRGTVGVLGDCTHPNTTTTAATSGLSPTRAKGDDFSAWGLDDYEAFIEDTLSNPIYENGIRTEYTFPVPNNTPGMFFEVFSKAGENPTYPEVWPRNYIPSYPAQINRNRISQLAVNGGHRTVKAIKTIDDPVDLEFGFELDEKNLGDTAIFTAIWSRLRYQYSGNFPMGDVTDGSEGTYLLNFEAFTTRTSDVTVATGTLTNPSSVVTISHKVTPNTGPSVFEVPLGPTAEIITTGTPLELVVYAGTVWDEAGDVVPNTYRVAVWHGSAFGTLVKLYDTTKPTSGAFQAKLVTAMRAKNLSPAVPEGDTAICYECMEWEYEAGAFGADPYGVEGLAWNPLGQSPTPNSFFATRATISGASGTVAITKFQLERSQTEVGEPHRFNGSLWYEWTAPASGTATFDTIGSDALVDTYLGIYTGTAINALTEIAVDDDSGGGLSSQVSFAATSGVVYKIQVAYRTNDKGNVTLNWSLI